MNVPGSRLRQIGWVVLLVAVLALFFGLSFKVHAVRSAVLLAERQIIELERENLMLETEFQTRASQRQLANWNAVEFGFHAPRADQYLVTERQLASLSLPSGPTVPNPVRLAVMEVDADGAAAGDEAGRESGGTRLAMAEGPMISPLTGRPVERAASQVDDAGYFAQAFGEILSDAATASTVEVRNLNADALDVSRGSGRNLLSAEVTE